VKRIDFEGVMFKKSVSWFRKKSAYDLLQLRIFKEVQRAIQLNPSASLSSIILPQIYGRKLPERVIELLLAWITYRRDLKILDVGHANAMNCHLRLLSNLEEPKDLTGIDISAPTYNPHLYYGESVIGEITHAPFLDDSFRLIWCISTLEHIGKDNSSYNCLQQLGSTDIQALDEMLRIVANGGSILITVPFGKYEDHKWFTNYDTEHLQQLLQRVRPKANCEEFYFRHTHENGWTSTIPQELESTGYYDEENAGAAGLVAVYIEKTSKQ
jgi:O-antigen chain-terminating methyltransferase